MASFVVRRLLERRCMALAVAAPSSLQHLHSLSSLHNLHSNPTSLPSHHHHPNPTSDPWPSLPTNLLNQSSFPPFSTPTFPHFSHLDPLSLFGPPKDRFIGPQSTTSLHPTLNPVPVPVPVHQFKFQREPNFALHLIPLSDPLGLEIESDEQIVIRADSVKKKRKRKMNKHKLKKLRKKLRRKT